MSELSNKRKINQVDLPTLFIHEKKRKLTEIKKKKDSSLSKYPFVTQLGILYY